MMKAIRITHHIRETLAAVSRAEAVYVPGGESAAVIEIPKLALADAVLDAVAVQARDLAARRARLAGLPKARPVAVVEVSLRPKRRRRA